MKNKLDIAYTIAETADVSTPKDSVVLYSISYQKTPKNKQNALEYMKNNPSAKMLDNTECGRLLIELGLETGNDNPPEELLKIWAIASKRFILSASGNITAFVDNANKRSTFISVELPLILQNEKILSINGIDKFEFAKQWKI